MTDHVKPGSDLAQDLQNLIVEYPDEVSMGVVQELESVMAESQLECPVEFGLLVASGYVDEPIVRPGLISCIIGYAKSYAIYVHEILTSFHLPPTKAKFLEDPLRRRFSQGFMIEQILARVNKILKVGP